MSEAYHALMVPDTIIRPPYRKAGTISLTLNERLLICWYHYEEDPCADTSAPGAFSFMTVRQLMLHLFKIDDGNSCTLQ